MAHLLVDIYFRNHIALGFSQEVLSFCHCSKIYPIAWIAMSPLSALCLAMFPHETVPNPSLESQV